MVYRAQNLNIKLFTSDKEAPRNLHDDDVCTCIFRFRWTDSSADFHHFMLKFQGVLSSAQKEVISQRSREVNKEILIITL